MSDLHHVKIKSPDGRGVLTTVTLDGEELRGVTMLSLTAGVGGYVELTLHMYADVEFDGEADIIKEWRNAREPEPVA